MRGVQDEGAARPREDAPPVCDVAPDGPIDDRHAEPPADHDDWTLEEEGYGYGV